MYLDIIAWGIIAGWIRGGKVANLGNLPVKGLWAILFLGLLELYIKNTQTADRLLVNKTLIMSFYCIIFLLLVINRKIAGVNFLLAGLALNFLVMAANGGRMPVSEWAVNAAGLAEYLPELYAGTASRHFLLTESTNLKCLADIIPLPPPYPLAKVLSLGDVILFIGIIKIVAKGMLLKEPAKKDNSIPGGDELQS